MHTFLNLLLDFYLSIDLVIARANWTILSRARLLPNPIFREIYN